MRTILCLLFLRSNSFLQASMLASSSSSNNSHLEPAIAADARMALASDERFLWNLLVRMNARLIVVTDLNLIKPPDVALLAFSKCCCVTTCLPNKCICKCHSSVRTRRFSPVLRSKSEAKSSTNTASQPCTERQVLQSAGTTTLRLHSSGTNNLLIATHSLATSRFFFRFAAADLEPRTSKAALSAAVLRYGFLSAKVPRLDSSLFFADCTRLLVFKY